MMFKKFLARGMHFNADFGWPNNVSVIADRNGGFGVNFDITQTIAIMPDISIQTGRTMPPVNHN